MVPRRELPFGAVALVLVVVDEPYTLLLLRRDLEAAGHAVVLSADADTAAERLAALPIEVVVLDVMMPVRDGWTVLEVLAALPHPPPALIVSPGAGPGDLARATRLGAAATLVPPFSADGLAQAVAALLPGDGAASS